MLTQYTMNAEAAQAAAQAPLGIKKLKAELMQRMQDLITWDKERRNIQDNLLVKARANAAKLQNEVTAASNGLDAFLAIVDTKDNKFTLLKGSHKKALAQVLDLSDKLKALNLKISEERALTETLMHGVDTLRALKKPSAQIEAAAEALVETAAGALLRP